MAFLTLQRAMSDLTRPNRGAHARVRLALDAGNIDIWLAYYRDIEDPVLLESMRALLNAAERNQEQRFHFADDRKRYLVTRALVRTTLSRYEAIAPCDWRFGANAFGRPDIANTDGDAAGICFNVSHTAGLIALAVSRHASVGVDVESLTARPAPVGIAGHFFAPAELASLSVLAPELRPDRFFEIWTFKEAYIKARGMGLSLPLDQFSLSFPCEHSVRLAIDAQLGDDPRRWRLWQLRPTPEHLLALCAERVSAAPPSLVLRKLVPLAGEELCLPVVLRSSSDPAG